MQKANAHAGLIRADVLSPGWRLVFIAVSLLAGLLGFGMAVLGLWLVALGGSGYYAATGLLLVAAAGFMLAGRRRFGLLAFGLAVAISVVWALWEIGGKGWLPSWGFDFAGRTGVIGGLFALALFAWAMGRPGAAFATGRRVALMLAVAAVIGAATLVALLWERPEGPAGAATASAQIRQATPQAAGLAIGRSAGPNRADEWTAFGGSNLGSRFSPADQITPGNVGGLREVWRFSTGDMAPNERVYFSSQNTPLKIDDTLYLCSSSNKVFALDPATGALRWRFDPEVPPRTMESMFSVACRAVGYHERPAAPPDEACARRIFVTTADGRLIALDARGGQRCAGFGAGGEVDLKIGMDMGETGFASSSSGPAVVGDLVVVGQQVSDNQRRDAPSGVVRAYDATTGAFRWAWDAKRLDRPQEPLAEGEVWPRGTPNVWNVISADESLGLVFLGTGNASNDHFGGNRAPEDDRFSAAVVAVDAATGALRWVYTTVLNDRWDYDIGAQPVVTDIMIDGAQRRVVLQATKTGSIFVLDARTGEPVRPVEMKPAPQGGVPGERLSPVQPQSVFYPNVAGVPGPNPEVIDARHAFGVTPLDGAWCRIQFHRMRYEGVYTPPTDRGLGMLLKPGTIGGPNWGGVAIDQARQILITNHSRLANRVLLVPRAQVDDVPIGDGGRRPDQRVAPQSGSPYGVERPIWLSPLQVPCIAPPWGFLAATDLASGRLLWSRPLGTGYDMGPLNIPTRLRIQIGTPNIGGPLATATGLTFIAAAQDDFLRAFETATGRLLWSARLPAGGQAGPMTYMHQGRQYVAIAATGHARLETKAGDNLVVYALPGP